MQKTGGARLQRRRCWRCAASAAQAADQLTLQLKWVTQAQFAGYYVAKDKGFYDEVGLDVTIKPGGPDINPEPGDRRRRRRRGGGLDALGAGDARKGRAAGQHRPGVPEVGHDADLPQRQRRHLARQVRRQDARRLVRRQRVSVPQLDEQARPQDRRQRRRREGAEAGLQRRPAAAEAGRLHLAP